MVRTPLTSLERQRGKRLGALLRRERGTKRSSIAQVAAKAGLSPETLRKIETGRAPTPSFFTVVALAAALDIPLDRLVEACCEDPPLSASA